MILTGKEITKEVQSGKIQITPFHSDFINPNSYDFRLGGKILTYDSYELDTKKDNSVSEHIIPTDGMILQPGKIYLGHTVETIGSNFFVPIIRAKSSIARLGLFVHITADLIDIGFIGQFTLQLNPVQPIRLYPDIRIGQVTFWQVSGQITLYDGKYQNAVGPKRSKNYVDFEK